jgi:membrane protease YdiL (CAAX protease family)
MDDKPEHVDRVMTPLAAALWTMALWLLEGVALEVTEAVRPGASHDVVNIGACTVLATSLVLFAMVRVHARDVSLRATLGVVPIGPLQFILAAAAGAGLYPLLSTVDAGMLARWPYSDSEAEALKSLLEMPTTRARVAFVVVGYLVMPVAHELYHRGIVFGGLRRSVGARVAMLATAVFSACCSPDWRAMPTTFVLGLALARVRDRANTVLAAIAAILAYWTVEALPIVRGADPMADQSFSTRWIVGGAVIAVLALVAIGAGRQEDAD